MDVKSYFAPKCLKNLRLCFNRKCLFCHETRDNTEKRAGHGHHACSVTGLGPVKDFELIVQGYAEWWLFSAEMSLLTVQRSPSETASIDTESVIINWNSNSFKQLLCVHFRNRSNFRGIVLRFLWCLHRRTKKKRMKWKIPFTQVHLVDRERKLGPLSSWDIFVQTCSVSVFAQRPILYSALTFRWTQYILYLILTGDKGLSKAIKSFLFNIFSFRMHLITELFLSCEFRHSQLF